MYKCEICGNTSQPHVPAYKVTIATRRVAFPFRERVFACWKQQGQRRKFVRPDDPGGTGRQIQREATACLDCAKRFANNGLPRRC